jgi:hypothetical protein
VSASQLSPELRALLRKHPLPRRTEGDRILKGDLAYGAGRYADAAANGASDLWSVFLAIESESGNELGKSVSRLAPAGRLALARWCFASGRVDVGIETFKSLVGAPDAGVLDDDFMEYLAQVEGIRGEDGFVAAADELLEKSSTSTSGQAASQRVLHACARAVREGDLLGRRRGSPIWRCELDDGGRAPCRRSQPADARRADAARPPATTRQSPDSAPKPSRRCRAARSARRPRKRTTRSSASSWAAPSRSTASSARAASRNCSPRCVRGRHAMWL